MPATKQQRTAPPAETVVEAPALAPYPLVVPPVDAPPASPFVRCGCGALLLARIWHHATEAMPAHWELCVRPIPPVCGEDESSTHICQQQKETT